MLFDALVLPDGTEAIEALSADGHALEFLKDQCRHCKTILVLGASTALLEKAGIPLELPSSGQDKGLLLSDSGEALNADAFIAAVGLHRHPARDCDPPRV